MIINDNDSKSGQTLNMTIWPENDGLRPGFRLFGGISISLLFGGNQSVFILFPKENHGKPLLLVSETASIYAYLLGVFLTTLPLISTDHMHFMIFGPPSKERFKSPQRGVPKK